jgi:CRP/FNR family transcriptional regulator, cyclic AMP receptor protein
MLDVDHVSIMRPSQSERIVPAQACVLLRTQYPTWPGPVESPIVTTVLTLTADLPERRYAAGDVVIREGTTTGSIWVLVSGTVTVRRGDEFISTVDQPGSVFGEVSLLIGEPHTATVVAATDAVLRHAANGIELFDGHAAFTRLVATDLARRLGALTAYLADVKRQYGAAPGLSMVSDVLQHLTRTPTDDQRPVSARDPDPEF